MRIAITGHSTGIGKSIAEAFEARGDTVLGMSPETGYTLPGDQYRVLDDAEDCDVFVNLWYERNTDFQLKFLYKLYYMWKGQDKHIISIGSRSGEQAVMGNISIYSTMKGALDEAHKQLFNLPDQRPRVTNVRPGATDTESSKDFPHPKLHPWDVADIVLYVVDAPFYISEITFCQQRFVT